MTVAHIGRLIVAAFALSIGWPVAAGWAQGAGTPSPMSLSGAGATFPAPLYKKWIAVYQAAHQNVSIAYEAVGSGEGVKRFLAETVDFAGSDETLVRQRRGQGRGGSRHRSGHRRHDRARLQHSRA